MGTTRNTKIGRTQRKWTDGVRRSMTNKGMREEGTLDREGGVETEILLLHCTVSKSLDECVN